MMNNHKEREAFEKLPDINAILHNSEFGFNEGINQYYHPNHAEHRLSYAFLMGAWLAWQAAKAQAVPEGFVLVKKELPEQIAEKMAIDRIDKPRHENDPVWSEIAEQSYKDQVKSKKWEFWRDYKAVIEAQEQK